MRATLVDGNWVTPSSFDMSSVGPVLGAIGGLQAGLGSYYSAKSLESNLRFQASIADINARMSENVAQSILDAGNKAQGQVSLKAGQVAGSQRASQGSRGIVAGVGNAAEEIATTNLMKETDMLTINANAVRQAGAARMQGTNYANDSLMNGTTADSISPFSAASTSMLNSATSVASSWYNSKKLNRLASILDPGGSF